MEAAVTSRYDEETGVFAPRLISDLGHRSERCETTSASDQDMFSVGIRSLSSK